MSEIKYKEDDKRLEFLHHDEIVRKAALMKPFSKTVFHLMRVVEKEDVNIKMVADVLGEDPVLTAQVLRLANSPFFGLGGNVGSIAHATTVLGIHTISKIALAASMANYSQPGQVSYVVLRHSICVAVIADFIAGKTGQGKDVAFTAGLLHDMGKLLLIEQFPARMHDVLAYLSENNIACEAAEKKILGIDHAELGEIILKTWGIPNSISNAVAKHHSPDDADAGYMGATIALANIICHELIDDEVSADPRDPVHRLTSMNRLGIDADALGAWLPDIEKHIAEVQSWMLNLRSGIH